MKRILYAVHKPVGLALGALLLLQALTGLAMLHRDGLLALFGPAVDPTLPHASLDEVIATIRAVHPDGTLERIVYHEDASLPLVARVYPRDSAFFHVAYVDPTIPALISEGPLWHYPLQLVERVHVALLGGRIGPVVLVAEALGLVFMAITGLVVWWPRSRLHKALRVHWRGAPPLRRLRDLHVVPGALMSLLMIVAGTTGAAIVAEPISEAIVSWFAPVTGLVMPRLEADAEPVPRVSWQEARELLEQRFPHGRLRQFRFLGSGERVLGVVMVATQATNPRAHHLALVDRWTGDLAVLADGDALTGGDAFLAWVLPVHTGEIYGPLRALVMSLLGLSVAGMTITGFLMWLRKRRPRRKAPASVRGGE